MKNNNRWKIFIVMTAVCVCISSGAVKSADLGGINAADIHPGAGWFGGAINTHDMMMLKVNQRELNDREDFENFKERKEKLHLFKSLRKKRENE